MKSTNISSPLEVGGVKLKNLLMNGAYIGSKSLEDIETLAQSASGAVVVGSISVKPRKQNSGQGYWQHKEGFFSLNSYGLPNGGIPYFEETLPKMVRSAHSHGKPLIANLVGSTGAEFLALIDLAQASGVDMVELNLGCPNVWDGGHQKRIISYHAALVTETLAAIRKQQPTIKLWVKISPLPPDILYEVGKAIAESGIVTAVTATNSYPNAYITKGAQRDGGQSEQLAGLAGRALKPISVGVIKQLHELLPQEIDLIGVGGISSANDVADYLLVGAKAVQIASALNDDGPSLFEKILFQNHP